ncbi:MAG TPA: enoyl-CoA hydratase/isomerase family protein, partial [Acidimicrobiales bacterium]|nr:enoyl-CoA hydratase/isomerase family protein [Acidimicrobiales bacterium]
MDQPAAEADRSVAEVWDPEEHPEVLVERRGRTVFVWLNRPDRLNALDWGLRLGLEKLWRILGRDRDLRCVVVTGKGRGFCAGAHMDDLAAERHPNGPSVHDEISFVPGFQLDVPVVVGVNGVCAGGGLHFVADADIVVAAESATFLDPHLYVGQVSGIEPPSLALRLPPPVLNRLVLLGRAGRMDAPTAFAAGMLSEVVADGELEARLAEIAAVLETASPTALSATRRVMRRLEWSLVGAAMQEGWEAVQDQWSHPDAVEGPQAFLERRPP